MVYSGSYNGFGAIATVRECTDLQEKHFKGRTYSHSLLYSCFSTTSVREHIQQRDNREEETRTTICDSHNSSPTCERKMAECPVKGESGSSSATNMGCPVKGDNEVKDATYNAAASDFSYNQHRQPGQVKDMSTVRPVSGIPKSTFTPGHQFANVDRWVYPSG